MSRNFVGKNTYSEIIWPLTLKEAKKSPIKATIKTEFEEEDPLEIKTENISDDEEMLQGQSWQTVIFWLALRDRNIEIIFFW